MLLDALRLAAWSGVRVQVIPTCSDSPFTDLISDSYVGPARRGDRTLPLRQRLLHAKLLIVDDDTASVGTANMDYRSLLDNLEVTAFIRDREVVRETVRHLRRRSGLAADHAGRVAAGGMAAHAGRC